MVIMAGGSGTRFWPASRNARPKQFLPISGRQSMLAETFARLEGLVPPERVLVVTAAHQAQQVRECLPQLPAENLLAEPMARNTAPCVAWAAHEIARRNPDALQAVLPADHVIEPVEAFQRTILAAAKAAREVDALYTLGVEPTFPATGYGYIEAGDACGQMDGIDVLAVKRFVEKPKLERAREFLQQGGFYWNAGIFVWSSKAILTAIETHVPALIQGLARVDAGEAIENVYPELPSEPIDTAVLEKAGNVRVLPVSYSWNDVGSWAALPDVHAADSDENYQVLSEGAKLIAHDSKGCVAYAEGERVLALIGVENLVVVQAGNATLVCPRERAQDVKLIVERLKKDGPEFL